MKASAVILLALAGCAMTPQEMSTVSDWNVCSLSMTPVQGEVAFNEARRRGLDCRPYYPAIQAQQANENAALQNFLRATQPPPAPTPRTMHCTSQQAGHTIQTACW